MSPEDRIYLNGLRDNLCARWGFTWRDVERAERRKRMADLTVRISATTTKVSAAFASFREAMERTNRALTTTHSAPDAGATQKGDGA